MKHLVAGLFALSLTIGIAQSWFPNGAEWYYTSLPAGMAAAGHVHVTVEADTIVVGQACKKLSFIQVLGTVQPPWGYELINLPASYVTEENGLVRVLNAESATFDTLYNMAALPSERWGFPSVPEWMDCAGPLAHFSVTDTGTMELDGLAVRWLAVDIVTPLPWDPMTLHTQQDTILERIGTLHWFIDPQDKCFSQGDANVGGPLRCYSDPELTFTHVVPWWPYNGSECAYLPNDIRDKNILPLRVFPIPASRTVHVELGDMDRPVWLELSDLSGRIVHRWQVHGTTERTDLDVSAIGDGGYVLRAQSTSSIRCVTMMVRH